MSQKVDVYTETMAKVYAEQGLWAKAAEIYRHLIVREPERRDFVDGLAKAEKKMNEIPQDDPEQLVPLFREWIDLLFQYEKLKKLRRLINKL